MAWQTPVRKGRSVHLRRKIPMPQPGELFQQQTSSEDSFLDLLVETLEGLDESARGQFLRQFFRTVVQTDFTETQSYDYWERILQRRRELSESSGRRAS